MTWSSFLEARTVGELRAVLAQFPDDLPLVVTYDVQSGAGWNFSRDPVLV